MRRLLAVAISVVGIAPRSVPAQVPPRPIESVEVRFDEARYWADQLSVTRSRAVERSIHGVPMADLEREYAAALARLDSSLARLDSSLVRPGGARLSGDDARAERAIRAWRRRAPRGDGTSTAEAGDPVAPGCRPPTAADSTVDGLEAAIFACYSVAAGSIVVGADTLDRLSILSRLGTTDDRTRREALFRALDQVWSSVNGHDEPDAPYRRLVTLRMARWDGGPTPMARRGQAYGLSAAAVEGWLVQALERWRRTLPDSTFEPWDYYHFVGRADRHLEPRIPRDSLLALNHRFYRALGADPDAIGVRYDIEPRPGKYPIAFTDFGARAVERDGRWERAEPWVFASYRIGGFGNLNELLHETGHAVHIAAIRTRPAFHDWPDSDTFTEGIADLATLEMFEPAWQQAYLGDSVPLAESIRAKYAGIMLDMAWALFEFRVHRPGAPSPNRVWTDITSRYLRIRPHPELSWWAMRGQLIESPGYMLNYALGAFLVADLRAALARRHGAIGVGRSNWYRQVSEEVFRFGAAVPAALVLRRVLGRPPSPRALVADLARVRTPGRP